MKENKVKISIGSVLVHKGNPPENNPFRGFGRIAGDSITHVSGKERVKALTEFKHGIKNEYTFWDASRGSIIVDRLLISPESIDWETSSIE